MTEYDESKIVIRNWPELYQRADGRWQRVWEIMLCEDPKDTVNFQRVQENLSTSEIFVDIEQHGKMLQATVTTDRWGWDDDLIWYAYKILSGINDQIGKIETIQGQARNLWHPWFRGVD